MLALMAGVVNLFLHVLSLKCLFDLNIASPCEKQMYFVMFIDRF